MPLHWIVDSKERLVITTAEGLITHQDVEDCMRAMKGAGTLSYRKLFDGSRGETDMTPEDMLAIGIRLRERHATGTPGPLAVVIPPDKAELISRVLGILATADRPMRFFSEVEPARRWIDSLPK